MTSIANNFTVTSTKPYVFVVDQRLSAVLYVDLVQSRYASVPLQSVKQPFSVAYDNREKMVKVIPFVKMDICASIFACT